MWHRVTVTTITSECTLDFLNKLISRSEVSPNRLVVDQSDVANTHNINTFLIGDEFLEELVEKSVIQRIVGIILLNDQTSLVQFGFNHVMCDLER